MHVLVIPSWFSQYPGDPSGSFFATQAVGVQQFGIASRMLYPDLRPITQLARYVGGKTAWTSTDGVEVLRHTYVNWTPRVEPLILRRWVAEGMRLFRRYLDRYGKPDLLHAHCLLRAGVLANQIAREYGIAYVVTEHSSRWHQHQVSSYELPHAQQAASAAAMLLTVSPSLLAHVQQDLRLGRTGVLPNAVQPMFLEGGTGSAADRDALTFINVALLNPGKRHDLLIAAFCQAFGPGTSHRLVIVGDGPQRAALERQIGERGMGARITLAGMQPREEVARMLEQSDCFVLSSDHETFGVVLIEAMAKGLPVVSTRCGGTDDLVLPSNGLLTEAGDAAALGGAMLSVAAGLAQGAYDGAAIRRECAARYSQQAVCTRLAAIYNAIAA